MPFTPEALNAIVAALKRFLDESAKEEHPQDVISFPNREWSHYDTGRATFIYKRPETAKALDAFRKKFETAGWLGKWSLGNLRSIEASLIDSAVSGASDDELKKSIAKSVDALDAEPKEFVAVLPIAHLYLGTHEETFSNVTLATVDDARFNDLRQTFYDRSESLATEGAKAHLREIADKATEWLRNRACAFIKTKGDADGAKADALRDAEPIADFLQLVAAISEHSFKRILISVGGDLLAQQPPRLLIAVDKSSVYTDQDLPFAHRLELNEVRMEQMRAFGLAPLINALNKTDADRTEFEAYLIRSMHWIADAERQERSENKITSYVTSIEMFFATKHEPLTRDVTEGTAMMLGGDVANRKNIMKRMGDFYEMRSGVSHAGAATIDEDDVFELKRLAFYFLAAMCSKAAQFKKKDEFRAWMAERRLGADEASTGASATATTEIRSGE